MVLRGLGMLQAAISDTLKSPLSSVCDSFEPQNTQHTEAFAISEVTSLRFGYCCLKIRDPERFILFLLILFQMLLSFMGKGLVFHGNCDLFRGNAGN